MRSLAPRQLLPVALGALLLTLLLAALWRPGDASTAMDRVFQSVLQPTATSGARLPTPTVRGGRAAPTATPAGRVLNAAHSRRLPLVIKGWPPTPTPTFTPTPTRTATPTRTPTPTATPTPTPIKYGWRGIDETNDAVTLGAKWQPAPTPTFWGVKYDWWYNWSPDDLTSTTAGAGPDATLAIMAQWLAADPLYVPMVFCPHDAVSSQPSPAQVANLAAQYPGRAWLMFNEPDNDEANGDGCGDKIRQLPDYANYYPPLENWVGTPWPWDPQPTATRAPTATPVPAGTPTPTTMPTPTPDSLGYNQLGKYLAQQYREYYCAIKGADPTARVFSFALMQLPMPNLNYSPGAGVSDDWRWYKRGRAIWDKFLLYLADPSVVAACADGRRPVLDGIAVHAYPQNYGTWHTGCQHSFTDATCVQQALADAHPYFQSRGATQSKSIWITETGSLTSVQNQAWNQTAAFMSTMLVWARGNFTDQIGHNQLAYYNAIGWFSMRDPRFSASDLINVTVTPMPNAPESGLSPVGKQWNQETCLRCECPGPDCPQ